MAVHYAATTLAPERLFTELEALSSLVVTVLGAHTNAAGLCAVYRCAWPCALVLCAGHNYHLAAMSCWVGPAAYSG
ncbi:MAG: hypothetical protein M3460_17955, partial [Actinomycetota bacterium]|nr:hypothetical protein [Actinomycetota bacterium]